MINATNPAVSTQNLPPQSLDQEETQTATGENTSANANAATSTQPQAAKPVAEQGISALEYDANFSTTRDPSSVDNNQMLMISPSSVNPNATQANLQRQMEGTNDLTSRSLDNQKLADANATETNALAMKAQVNPDFRPASPRNGTTVYPPNGLPPVNRFTPYNPNAQRQFATDTAVGIGSSNRYQIQVNSPNVSPANARKINTELQSIYQNEYVKPSADNVRRYKEEMSLMGITGAALGGWAGGWKGAVAGAGLEAIAATRNQNERHTNTITSYAKAVNEVLQRNNIPTVSRDQLLNVKTY
jgi:hypothetical protein